MSEGKNSQSETTADRTMVLTRVFDAPRHLVFEACTKKEHIDQWMAPHGFTMRTSGGDFREGGKWHFMMTSPTEEPFPVGGIYQKIVPDELVVFSHAWVGDDGKPEHETTVTMRFEDAGAGKTKLTLEQSIFKSMESRDNHVGGWSQCLEKLGALLAKIQTQD